MVSRRFRRTRIRSTTPDPFGQQGNLGVRQFSATIAGRHLRAVGIVLHIRLVSFNQRNATMTGPADAWQAITVGDTLLGMPDGSGNFDSNGTAAGGYADPEMDRLIAASVDQPGRDALFAYEDYAAAQQPVNILPQGGFALLAADRLGGVERFSNPQGFWAPEELWVRDGACAGVEGGGAGR